MGELTAEHAGTVAPGRADATRTLVVTGVNHALHDGYTDLIYVLLPIWQAEFALSYGVLACMRALYAGAMAGLQIPVGRLALSINGRTILALGTALSALGYFFAGFSGGVFGLGIALTLSGAGSSTQHPIASAAVARAYGSASRAPLGIYNFSGDLGKAAIPGAISLLLLVMSWRHALQLVAVAGLLVAAGVILLMPPVGEAIAPKRAATEPGAAGRGGFFWLFSIGVLDTAVRMGLLTFLPFLLHAKGTSVPMSGLALTLVFIGGAAGKFVCGWLGERVGTLRTVLLTEGGTAACILAVLVLPLAPAIALLPLLGLMLNGTSSVLYGTVPELAAPHRTERAFAVFYTGTIGSGAISPVLYGILGDALGPTIATTATALTALAIIPLAFALARHLAPDPAEHSTR
ncbi:MFS transporter [Bradyrhizobium sp. S69]|uniref:MFS transporter n=1 Tax=Bradyrhizobium sp. S69 TaxID=1641856 RepID=UPI00131E721F|nr:MFS transporter [Bradyrhizobium sp. S69]